ncbi:MAG: glycosyltransferase [Chitinophagaceae bacterium]|nr:MAG: glycosyltransferase [Chitinophagaceae bacterium]
MNKTSGTITVWITIPWFFPAWRAGGPVQSVQNLVAGPVEGIEYRIYCGHAEWDGSPLPGIETGKWVPYNQHTFVWYAGPGKRRQDLVRELERVAPDILFVNGIYDWYFNILPLWVGRKMRRIVSVRGMLHPGALAQKGLKKKLFLGLWKALRLHRYLEFHAATGEEKGHIKTVFGKRVTIHVAANLPRTLEKQEIKDKIPGCLSLVTVALISPMKNILLVLEALKTVKERVEYHLFGPVIDKGYWQQCTAVIHALPPNITVHVYGGLNPADLPMALGKGHMFILPSRSENFCHAIYEALVTGKPVITSHHTPWNSLQEAKAGRNVAIKDNEDLAETIRYFAAMTGEELEEWSRGATAYANKKIDRHEIRQQYRRMFVGEDKNAGRKKEGRTNEKNRA